MEGLFHMTFYTESLWKTHNICFTLHVWLSLYFTCGATVNVAFWSDAFILIRLFQAVEQQPWTMMFQMWLGVRGSHTQDLSLALYALRRPLSRLAEIWTRKMNTLCWEEHKVESHKMKPSLLLVIAFILSHETITRYPFKFYGWAM